MTYFFCNLRTQESELFLNSSHPNALYKIYGPVQQGRNFVGVLQMAFLLLHTKGCQRRTMNFSARSVRWIFQREAARQSWPISTSKIRAVVNFSPSTWSRNSISKLLLRRITHAIPEEGYREQSKCPWKDVVFLKIVTRSKNWQNFMKKSDNARQNVRLRSLRDAEAARLIQAFTLPII